MLSKFLVGVPSHLLLGTRNVSMLSPGQSEGVAVLIQGHCKNPVPIPLPFHEQERKRNEMCFPVYQSYEGSCY